MQKLMPKLRQTSIICKKPCFLFENYDEFQIPSSLIFFSEILQILNCRVVGARQSFQIFGQNTWFLQNNRDLSKFLYVILNSLVSITKL